MPAYMIALNRRVHDLQRLEAYWKAAGPTFEGRGSKALSSYTPVTPLDESRNRNYGPISLVQIIGREEDVNELADQLPRKRFITITGTGGIGKTTVALAVVEKLSGAFRDAAIVVDLASLAGPLVVAHLASLLRLPAPDKPPLQYLVAYLRTRRMLVVLDNCEHVIEAVSEIAEALSKALPRFTS